MGQYKIAMVQMDCEFLNKKENVKRAERFIEEAAENGASLICLPEAFNTGYLGSDIPAMMTLAEPLCGAAVTAVRAMARRLGIHIIAPILYRADNGAVENTAVFIDDDGSVVGTYSKTHLVGDERIYLQRGKNYTVWDTKLGKIGILICYDICFPETSRMLALNGAELIIVPAAWRAGSYFKEWWDLNLACRALDNLVYVAAVNRRGQSGEEIFAGKSQIISPTGQVLVAAGIEEERIIYQTISTERVAGEREFNTVFKDRHPEDYKPVWEKQVAGN